MHEKMDFRRRCGECGDLLDYKLYKHKKLCNFCLFLNGKISEIKFNNIMAEKKGDPLYKEWKSLIYIRKALYGPSAFISNIDGFPR